MGDVPSDILLTVMKKFKRDGKGGEEGKWGREGRRASREDWKWQVWKQDSNMALAMF